MKKYILLLIPLFIWGCEKKYDSVIDPGTTSVRVRNVNSFPSKTYDPGDSTITASLTLYSSTDVNSVYIDVYSSDNTKLNDSPFYLYDDGNTAQHGDIQAGDFVYTNLFPLSQSYPNGKYTIEYYVTDKSSNTQLAAKQTFIYNNAQSDIPPVISNLVAPDTLVVAPVGDTTKTIFFLSVAASDSNGQNDIQSVYFIVYKPDGSTNGNKVPLLDDGGIGSNSGDVTAGDGVYSFTGSANSSNPKGTYRFDFQAQDRQNKLSNIISHNIVIK